jgi:hypothetical protein
MEEAREALASARKAWADLEEQLSALEEARGIPESVPEGRTSAEVALLVESVERLDPHRSPGMGRPLPPVEAPRVRYGGKSAMATMVGAGLFAAGVLIEAVHAASQIHAFPGILDGTNDPAADERKWRLVRKRLLAGSRNQKYRKEAAAVALALSTALPAGDEAVAPVLDALREVAAHPGHRTQWSEFVGAVEARVGILHRRHLLAGQRP